MTGCFIVVLSCTPAKLNKDGSNQSLVEARKVYSLMGNAYLAKYLYHIQSDKEIERNSPI